MSRITYELPLESTVAGILQTDTCIERIHELATIAAAGGCAALGLVEDSRVIRDRVAMGITSTVAEEEADPDSPMDLRRITRLEDTEGVHIAALITSRPATDSTGTSLLPSLGDVLRYASQPGKAGRPEISLRTILGRATLLPEVGGVVLTTIWPAQSRRPGRDWDKLLTAGGYEDAPAADQTQMLLSAGFDTGRQLLRKGRILSAGRDPDFPEGRPRKRS